MLTDTRGFVVIKSCIALKALDLTARHDTFLKGRRLLASQGDGRFGVATKLLSSCEIEEQRVAGRKLFSD
jgi:hypothetical protein